MLPLEQKTQRVSKKGHLDKRHNIVVFIQRSIGPLQNVWIIKLLKVKEPTLNLLFPPALYATLDSPPSLSNAAISTAYHNDTSIMCQAEAKTVGIVIGQFQQAQLVRIYRFATLPSAIHLSVMRHFVFQDC